jgi:hypothetical protein
MADQLKERIELIEASMKSTGRTCGTCSMCCKVLSIDAEPGFIKPADTWCQHCRPGRGGCSIYADRPSVCRGFACEWLISDIPDLWNPQHSKIVIHMAQGESEQRRRCLIHVDRTVPYRWREPPYYDGIKSIAFHGLHDMPFTETHVIVGGRKILVLPEKEVDITDCEFPVISRDGNHWDVKLFDSETEALQFQERLRSQIL